MSVFISDKDMANLNAGLAQGERLGVFWGRAPPLFEKKKKLRKTHFQIKGICDRIKILDWRTSLKHPNL